MLSRQKHDYYLRRILRDIVSDEKLRTQLALKGGTCLYLFYGLDRLSVDLDFNLINKEEFSAENMDFVLSRYLDIERGKYHKGKNGWFWKAGYGDGERNMQIDVNINKFPDKYVIKQFYGLSINTLEKSYIFAHKLCAITDRSRLANRDLYYSWFMFDRGFDISEKIVRLRTNQSLVEYLQILEEFIRRKVNRKQNLAGIGELLNDKQKQWVKHKLVDELLNNLRLMIDSLEK